MKKLLLYILCIVASLPLTSVSAQDDNSTPDRVEKPSIKEQTFQKTFDAERINELKLTNEHGFVHVSTWNEETVQVDIIVNIETRYESNLEDLLKLLTFTNRSYSKKLDLKTVFSEDFFSNYPFTINYMVKVPSRLNLSVTNSIGDVRIDSINGNINLTQSYGHLELTNIAKDKQHKLNLSFVEGRIDSFGQLTASFQNCTLNIGNGQKVNTETSYCMASFVNINSMNLKTFTDRLTVTNVDSLHLTGSQFIGKVEDLHTYLFCELNKGQIFVETTETLRELTLSNKEVKTSLTIPYSVSYQINGEVRNGAFTHPTPQALQLIKENNVISFSGKIGESETPQANLIVFNEDSSISIKN
ncbi:hypothetical protein [Carboxylicivirga taeanensis]|uniref:hypothetical protein n=1 Tax=Carboxylicivirga taeanensis TaxID=1416875 RepID=UPI003F6DEF92